jgi:Fe-coproporphyrin III synthase
MCNIWKNPTLPDQEITPELLSKLPGGFDQLNLTGGEPTLRTDLMEICDVLYSKGKVLEISTNGSHPEKILPIIKKYPDVKIRFSLDGMAGTSDSIRGEKKGFETKVEGLKLLKEAGGTDLGFAIVIQDENVTELMDVYRLSTQLCVDLSVSTLHNGWQFHKNDNYHYDRLRSAKAVENLISALMKTYSVKKWFRGYISLGLIEKILGHTRIHPCVAGTGFMFIDPWADVWACNVRKDLKIGNLWTQSWEDIVESDVAEKARIEVKNCSQNCWMMTTARTGMRSKLYYKLPKIRPLLWVIENKIRTMMGKNIRFEKYIDYSNVLPNRVTSSSKESVAMDKIKRVSYLDTTVAKNIQKKEDIHYTQKEYFNI